MTRASLSLRLALTCSVTLLAGCPAVWELDAETVQGVVTPAPSLPSPSAESNRVSLDLSKQRQWDGRVPLFVPHNGLLTFALDGRPKAIAELGPDTVVYRATKMWCDPDAQTPILEFFQREAHATGVRKGPGQRVVGLKLIAPRQMTPPGPYQTSANASICYGWRDAQGWHWSLAPRRLEPSADGVSLTASLQMDHSGADALAIIFSDGAAVQEIAYDLKP